jgi:hypothetical protein
MINDTVLYTGDRIDNFTVRQIGKETVTIERDGVSIELKMN